MTGLLEIDFGQDARVRRDDSGLLKRVRHQDAEIDIESGEEVGLVLNLTQRHRVDAALAGLRHTGRPEIGSLSVIPPRSRFRGRISGTCSVVVLSLPWSTIAQAAEAGGADARRLDVKPRLNAVEPPLARSVYAALAESEAGRVDALATVAAHLATAPPPPWSDPARGGIAPARLKRVIDLIDASLSTPLPLACLAAEAAMSPFHFARVFAAATGRPPHQYLLHRRLNRAAELMAESELAVGAIARLTGFTHASHLARAFSQRTATTPSGYRSRILP